MVINKNNGKIIIEEKRACSGFITSIKTLAEYKIIVLDQEEMEKLKATYSIYKIDNKIMYKLNHNCSNYKLVKYIQEELKKHIAIDI